MKRFKYLKHLVRDGRAQSEKIGPNVENPYRLVLRPIQPRTSTNIHVYVCSTMRFPVITALSASCVLCTKYPVHVYQVWTREQMRCALLLSSLVILFFDSIMVGRGATFATSILSCKVSDNCQTSRLRWIMLHFPHCAYIFYYDKTPFWYI